MVLLIIVIMRRRHYKKHQNLPTLFMSVESRVRWVQGENRDHLVVPVSAEKLVRRELQDLRVLKELPVRWVQEENRDLEDRRDRPGIRRTVYLPHFRGEI
jgi:hypothetical protein